MGIGKMCFFVLNADPQIYRPNVGQAVLQQLGKQHLIVPISQVPHCTNILKGPTYNLLAPHENLGSTSGSTERQNRGFWRLAKNGLVKTK